MKALEETFRETMPPGMGYDYMACRSRKRNPGETGISERLFG